MKRLFYILFLCLVSFFVKGQVTPVTGGYPITQNIGSANTIVRSPGGALGGNFVVWRYTDTTAANLTQIKNYPFAIIATTANNSLWTRNQYATQWMAGSGTIDIDNFEFINDSTLVICFSNGSCDTVSMNNFNTVVNNLIQNFIDSSIFNLNDSTIIICNAAGSCDTIDLGTTNNYFFLNDSTLVTCDTLETICVGDSCYQQQICDTIPIPNIVTLVFQNGLRRLPGSHIIEMGSLDSNDHSSALYHQTYLHTDFSNLAIWGKPNQYEVLSLRQSQWSQNSSSIMSWNHQGTSPYVVPPLVNPYNQVNLYMNYIAPMYKFGSGGGDSTGFMGTEKVGYSLMTNSRGVSYSYDVDDEDSKQGGILFHTMDAANIDGITLFYQQVPSSYPLNTGVDSNFLSKRIVVFKTDQSSNFLGKVFLTNGRLENDTAQVVAANNLTLGLGNVNIVSGNTQINAITTSGWQAGSNAIDIVFSGAPLVKNNTAGGAGTATILLAGLTDFQAAAGDVLSLLFDGTNWRETNRTLAATPTTTTANNGVSLSGSTVQLGQAVGAVGNPAILLNSREIPMGGFTLALNASATQADNLFQTTNAAAAIRARITSAADFSNTGGQTNSEKFGEGATVADAGSTSIGKNTTSAGPNQVVIGFNANGGNNASTVVGANISVANGLTGVTIMGVGTTHSTNNRATLFGASITSTGRSTGIGSNSTYAALNNFGIGETVNVGHDYSGAIGFGATTTAANQLVFGDNVNSGTEGGINDIFWGEGTLSEAPNNVSLNANSGIGTNIAAGSTSFNFSRGTGTGIPGDGKMRTSVPEASGTTLQTLGDRYSIIGKYTTLTEATATSFARVNVPTGTVAGGEVIVTVEANDGTEFQVRTLTFAWTAANKAGTTDADISTPVESISISSGTLTVTITIVDAGSGNVDFKADATSSLTQTVLRANCQVLKNFGTGSITAQ